MEPTTRTEDLAHRERKAKRLAAKLFFKLDRQGRGLRWAPFYAFLRPLGLRARALTPTSLEELGFGLVRFGSTKCFRVFQPRPLSVEDGFKAGDNFLVRKIKTEGSNRN